MHVSPGTDNREARRIATVTKPGSSEYPVLRVERAGGLTLRFSGRLDAATLGPVWDEAVGAVRGAGGGVVLDMGDVDYMDGAGAGLLFRLRQVAAESGGRVEISGLRPELKRLLALFDEKRVVRDLGRTEERLGLVATLGRNAYRVWRDLRAQVAFVGEATVALSYALRHSRRVRWKDVLHICEQVGSKGVPIVALTGFLMGLITSFQSAITLERFGGGIFVADMLGLAMCRELGPLVTCILLAGRSGSAFAAEIGTMKVNEEINALDTMGLSPMRFLVVPRVLAAVAMVPLLNMFFIFASLVGGAIVMLTLGYPLATFTGRVFRIVSLTDFGGGMAKSLVFGLLVAGVGCMRGLNTGTGAGSVGESTTSAVVSGILLLAVADGIFAVLYYMMGI